MLKTTTVLQPRCFETFHCIGSDCEDTCCDGWGVMVDKRTYEKYQNCSDPALAPRLHSLITINPTSSSDDDYAKITLSGSRCPFLAEGECSIQKRLGEEYLSDMCATYPRVMNLADGVLQRSLDLSCPEAARVVLLNSNRMEFDEEEYVEGAIRHGKLSTLDSSGLSGSSGQFQFLREMRGVIISLLQDRAHSMSQRLFMVGRLCAETASRDGADLVAHGPPPADFTAQPAIQLEVAVELILARIGSDFTPHRFLDCYREFMEGIRWTSESTMQEIASRYAEAYSQYYAPFISRHEYLLENYVVNYVYRTLFPFGSRESNQRLKSDGVGSSITSLSDARYMLMIAHYAVTRTVLIGMAGLHKSAFGLDHVIKLIQSGTRTFEHSLSFPGRVIEILADKGMTDPASLRVLIQN